MSAEKTKADVFDVAYSSVRATSRAMQIAEAVDCAVMLIHSCRVDDPVHVSVSAEAALLQTECEGEARLTTSRHAAWPLSALRNALRSFCPSSKPGSARLAVLPF